MTIRMLAALAVATQFVGCASIVNGQNQSVSVETRTDAGSIAGAKCQLSNNKGTWFVTSPGSTIVQRSFEDLGVRCEKEPHEPGMAAVKSSTKAMAFGNIIFGGIIGVGVDVATGAAYDYPTLITVMMGKTTAVGAPPAAAETPPAPPVVNPATQTATSAPTPK
jgi:hypothetical protein